MDLSAVNIDPSKWIEAIKGVFKTFMKVPMFIIRSVPTWLEWVVLVILVVVSILILIWIYKHREEFLMVKY